MQSHHDADHARPTADWIRHYAADLMAAAPGMHPLDAVRRALETVAASEPPSQPAPRTAAPSPSRRPPEAP